MGSQFCICEVCRLLLLVCALLWMSTGTVRKSKPSHTFEVPPSGSGLYCRRQRSTSGGPPPRVFKTQLEIMSFLCRELAQEVAQEMILFNQVIES